ncbi:hypothetical protein [Rubeoparvulum massiliense]|uniref:hypothetical protein n=1 Tax=Rubeoparvulum massiliense TaxID=1631346 RepID=UPI00065E466D|nr:hypothetical protein [Rubeoparvulum massiliense]
MTRRVIGTIILILGIVLLVGNLGGGSWDYLYHFFKWLPILIIIFGVALVLKGAVGRLPDWWPIPVILIYSGVILIITLQQPVIKYEDGSYQFQTAHTEITEGALRIDSGAVDLTVRSGKLTPPQWLTGTYGGIPVTATLEEQKNRIRVDWKQQSFSITNWFQNKLKNQQDIQLSPHLIWDVEVDTGASDVDLEFADVPVRSIVVKSGASDLLIRLGNFGLETKVSVDAGVSDLDIYLPRGAGVRIDNDSGLSDNNFVDQGFIKDGSYYENREYPNATTRFTIKLSMGVSNIKLNYY